MLNTMLIKYVCLKVVILYIMRCKLVWILNNFVHGLEDTRRKMLYMPTLYLSARTVGIKFILQNNVCVLIRLFMRGVIILGLTVIQNLHLFCLKDCWMLIHYSRRSVETPIFTNISINVCSSNLILFK